MSKGYRTVTIRLTPQTERQLAALIAASQRSSTRAPQTVSDILRQGVQQLWDHRQRSRRSAAKRRKPAPGVERVVTDGMSDVQSRLDAAAAEVAAVSE